MEDRRGPFTLRIPSPMTQRGINSAQYGSNCAIISLIALAILEKRGWRFIEAKVPLFIIAIFGFRFWSESMK